MSGNVDKPDVKDSKDEKDNKAPPEETKKDKKVRAFDVYRREKLSDPAVKALAVAARRKVISEGWKKDKLDWMKAHAPVVPANTAFPAVSKEVGLLPQGASNPVAPPKAVRKPSAFDLFRKKMKDHPDLVGLSFGDRQKKFSAMWKLEKAKGEKKD